KAPPSSRADGNRRLQEIEATASPSNRRLLQQNRHQAAAMHAVSMKGREPALVMPLAAARRAEQVEQEPHRQDDQEAEQRIGQRPGEAAARQLLQPLVGQAELARDLLRGDAEMR